MRRFFLFCVFSFFCWVVFSFVAEGGPLLNMIRRSRSCPAFLTPSSPSCELPPVLEEDVLPLAPGALCPFVVGEPISPLQSIVLEPRPGTGLGLLPGKNPPVVPEALVPSVRVPITLDQGTQDMLKSAGGRLDTFLSLASVVMAIFGGGHALQWAVRAVGGLLPLIAALSRAAGAVQSGVPQPVLGVNPAVLSSTPSPGT